MIGVALSRRRPDFSERERGILEVAQPLIVGANERVTMTLMHGALSALEHAAEAVEQAIIVLHPGGRLQFATAAAAAALRDLPRADRPDQLPEPLASWCEQR